MKTPIRDGIAMLESWGSLKLPTNQSPGKEVLFYYSNMNHDAIRCFWDGRLLARSQFRAVECGCANFFNW